MFRVIGFCLALASIGSLLAHSWQDLRAIHLGNEKAKGFEKSRRSLRVVAKLLLRALGIKPIEDFCEGLFRNTRTCVLHHNEDAVVALPGPYTYGVSGLAERQGIGDQIDKLMKFARLLPWKIY